MVMRWPLLLSNVCVDVKCLIPLPYLRTPPQIKPPPLLPGERPDLLLDPRDIPGEKGELLGAGEL